MPSAVDVLLFLGGHLASLLVIVVSSFVIGRQLLCFLPVVVEDLDDAAGEIAVSCSLGLAAMATGLLALGLVGSLQRDRVLVVLVAACLLCRSGWCAGGRLLRQGWSVLASRSARRYTVIGLVVLVPLVVLALYPPSQFDETLYHLPYAKTFAAEGQLRFIPELRFPVFPQLNELLFVLGLHLSGDVVPRLTQLLTLVLTALLLLSWGQRAFPRTTGGLACALWLGTPLAIWIGTSASIDLGLTLFVTAALFTWERWQEQPGAHNGWLLLAGTFAGCAAASKYLGLFFLAAIALLTAWHSVRERRLAPLLLLCLSATVVMAPWYARILITTGNPVFPYYSALFGDSEWTPHHPGSGSADAGDGDGDTTVSAARFAAGQLRRVTADLGFLVMTPLRGVYDREVFNLQAPLSPYSALLVLLLGPPALLSDRTRRYLLLAIAYGLFWLTTIRDLRFLLPILPVLGLGLVVPLARLLPTLAQRGRLGRWLPAMLIALLLAPGPAYACWKIFERGWPPVSDSGRQAFLTRQVVGYEALQYLNTVRGSRYTVYTYRGEHLAYYADGQFLGDAYGPFRYERIIGRLRSGRGLYHRLRAAGADYLLILRKRRALVMPDDAGFRRQFRKVLDTPQLVLYELLPPQDGNPAGGRPTNRENLAQ